MRVAKLRVCASCEWVFHINLHQMCPKCGFGHYGAHYVYGKKAYKYFYTQDPWLRKKLNYHEQILRKEIMSSFKCEHCNEDIIDTPKGYITGCEHYPLETIKGHVFKRLDKKTYYSRKHKRSFDHGPQCGED